MDSQKSPFDYLSMELLINIVSRLPFKEGVRTSVLAKRWIKLWRYSTNMELNQGFFRNPLCFTDPGSIGSVRFRVFSEIFMHYFLGSELESFTLIVSLTDRSMPPMLNRAVLFSIKHRVKHLTLDLTQLLWDQQPLTFKSPEYLDLPNEFYDHLKNIESLKLSSVSISLFECSHFSSLRTVSFHWIRFWKAELRHLVSKASLLEDLTLKRCTIYKLKIDSNSLRKLALEECDVVKDTVSLTTPNLKSFVFSGRPCSLDLTSAAMSLENASVRFDLEPPKPDFDENICYHQFKTFSHVKDLTVCSYILQLLPSKKEDFNQHLELNHLTIRAGSFDKSVFRGCIFFMKCCPRMETLSIDLTRESYHLTGWKAPVEEEPYEFWTAEDNKNIECLVALKSVELIRYDGSCLLREFLSHVLKTGKMLETVILKSVRDSGNVAELQNWAKDISPRVQICQS